MSRDESVEPMETPVRFVKGVGERRAELLERLDVRTVGDLLMQIPRRYEDRRRFVAIRDLTPSGTATVSGRIEACGWVRPRWGKGYFEAAVNDGTGVLICRWFNARYLEGRMKPGQSIVAYGKIGVSKKHGLTMQHPEFEFSEEGEDSLNLGRIVPVYQSTENLPQRVLRSMVANAVERYAPLAEEFLPEQMNRKEVSHLIEEIVEENGYGPRDLGKVMKQVMGEHGPRVDGGMVNEIAREKLAERD